MPFYLHQWNYKDPQIRQMLLEPSDRADVVGAAVRAFGGTLHGFFYCFGQYDGVALSEFASNEEALACVLAIFGQGRISSVHTTALFGADEGMRVMRRVHSILESRPPMEPPGVPDAARPGP